jgi:hypothetical protein
MVLKKMAAEIVTAAVVIEASVAATRKDLHEALDFAFFDVDVTNGKALRAAPRKRCASIGDHRGRSDLLESRRRTRSGAEGVKRRRAILR